MLSPRTGDEGLAVVVLRQSRRACGGARRGQPSRHSVPCLMGSTSLLTTFLPNPPSISGRPNPLQITPLSISGRPNPLQITPLSISGRPSPLQITPPSISGRPNPLRITRRVFLGAGAPKLLRRSPPYSFRRSAARDELRRKRNGVLRDLLPWAERLRREHCTRRRAAELPPRSVDEGLAVVVLRDRAEELAAAHGVGTHPAQRPMPDVLDFPCVSGRIAVGMQHLVALFPQCRCGGESCVREHAAHRAVAGACCGRARDQAPCTQTNAAQVSRPSSRPQRQAVWCLPGAWVETGHAALPGPGQSRRQPTASRAQTSRKSASEAGGVYHASTVAGRLGARAPGRHHAASRSAQTGRPPPSRSDGN